MCPSQHMPTDSLVSSQRRFFNSFRASSGCCSISAHSPSRTRPYSRSPTTRHVRSLYQWSMSFMTRITVCRFPERAANVRRIRSPTCLPSVFISSSFASPALVCLTTAAVCTFCRSAASLAIGFTATASATRCARISRCRSRATSISAAHAACRAARAATCAASRRTASSRSRSRRTTWVGHRRSPAATARAHQCSPTPAPMMCSHPPGGIGGRRALMGACIPQTVPG